MVELERLCNQDGKNPDPNLFKVFETLQGIQSSTVRYR